MKIDYIQALKRTQNASGAWLMHGQEPLLEQNLLDQFRKEWSSKDIERQRYDIQSVSDWKNVFNALNSLSLFSQQLAIEAHGNIKPDASDLKMLKAFLQHNEQNLLVIVMPKQDGQSLKSSFIQTVEANGTLVTLNAPYPKDRQQILEVEAKKLSIQLENDAWTWLLEHHEHNLLAAKNSLIRVNDTFPDIKNIGIKELQSCLQDQSRYSTYDLSDSLLTGNFEQSIKIYQYLIATGEPMTFILWVISKEMRLLMQLFEQPQNGLQLGIWKTKLRLYQNALRRFQPQQFLTWPHLLLEIDLAIKGNSQQKPELLILQAIGQLCGKVLFK
ncbi:DNA polymerase III subunit delta [Acinetobacter nectaris]|uniref:DNA polymerase III subunit delta n=1 Tax=Acinetobacter nectaris TaxID=1219382 RepID=UPI001EFF9BDD|nr:DNA polymerase III subunit delta [Acinetobacter nectaris]MCF9046812.1 DNA polymerase III subunit delta [Acinetobacter nectaris]